MSLARRAFLSASAAALSSRLLPAQSATRLGATFPQIPGAIQKPGEGGGPFAALRARLQYECDEEQLEISLNDLHFFSPTAGLAVGAANRKGRGEGFALTTSDGKSWSYTKIKDVGLAICPVSDSAAYITGANGLYFANPSCSSFEKRKYPKVGREERIIRAHFYDPQHGVLFGAGKTLYETDDGGLTYQPVAKSTELAIKSPNTAWNAAAPFGNHGVMIVGHSEPLKEVSRFPSWMMPEAYLRRRVTATTTLLARRTDRDAAWDISATSTIGTAIRARNTAKYSYVIYHYGDNLEYSSELFRLDFATNKGVTAFRHKDLILWDAMPLASGAVLIAAIQPAGKLRSSGIPGKLRLFALNSEEDCQEISVHYRAVGNRAVIAKTSNDLLWVATDEGAILHLSA